MRVGVRRGCWGSAQPWSCVASKQVVDDYDLHDPGQRSALESVCRKCNLEENAVKPAIRARCQRARVTSASNRRGGSL